jgi:REP element-mobilizing transposase RayT
MPYYERHLPHWNPEDAALFITWRLKDSLPRNVDLPTSKGGKAFVAVDRMLDRPATGPTWLRQPEVARCVYETLRDGAEVLKLYDLCAWTIMCNHVHILIDPRAQMDRITNSIKGYSAHEANRILGRKGAFWQTESYDRWIRSSEARERVVRYIEWNPVSAGLVSKAEDYRWSSAWAGEDAYPTKTSGTR